jgi:glucose-6-phosphate 1-epimerase
MSRGDARVHVVHLRHEHPPAGWGGKSYALQSRMADAQGEWLLFVDADVTLEPDVLSASLATAVKREFDLISLLPRFVGHSFWEKHLQPLAGAATSAMFLIALTNSNVNKTAFANGQFLLVRRAAYDAIGGHEAIRGTLSEDVAIARKLKNAGYRPRLSWADEWAQVRMYEGFGAIFRGWGRNFFVGSLGRPWRILAAIAFIFVCCFSCYAAIAWGLTATRTRSIRGAGGVDRRRRGALAHHDQRAGDHVRLGPKRVVETRCFFRWVRRYWWRSSRGRCGSAPPVASSGAGRSIRATRCGRPSRAMSNTCEIPGVARVEEGRGGMRRVVVNSDLADAEVYLHGAHVTHFHPRGQRAPVLFLSRQSRFEPGKAIRGGVPICFPWFGPHPTDPGLPQHGYARTTGWTLESITQDSDGEIVVSLAFEITPVRHVVTIGRSLRMELHVANPTAQDMEYEEALHTYLHVGDVRRASVTGLERCDYIDKVQDGSRMPATGEPIRFDGETDRVYQDTRDTCIVEDPALGRRIIIEKTNSDCTVVWNPWVEKAKAMKDFGDDEWPAMVCVETANVGDSAVVVGPGDTHTMSATIHVE